VEVQALLVPILGAVDRFGLKTLAPRKFNKEVERFYQKNIAGKEYGSEAAETYRKRFELLCRKPVNRSSISARIMRCDHEQIPATGLPGRLRRGPSGPPRAPTPVQPQEVHPAPAHGLPGAQGVPPPRLSRIRRAPGRPPRPRTPHRPEGRPPLHHLPEGRRAAAQGGPGPQAVRCRARPGAAPEGPQAAGPAGGRRRHRDGEPARQPYYVKRRSRTRSGTQETTYSRYPKVVLVTDCRTHLCWRRCRAAAPPRTWCCSRRRSRARRGRARIGTLLADADFDGEWVHEHVRSYGIRTLIPPERGRPSDKAPAGRWRRWMRQQFRRFKAKYGQRWQTEAVNSMIKRRLGSALRGAELLEPVPRDHPPGHHT